MKGFEPNQDYSKVVRWQCVAMVDHVLQGLVVYVFCGRIAFHFGEWSGLEKTGRRLRIDFLPWQWSSRGLHVNTNLGFIIYKLTCRVLKSWRWLLLSGVSAAANPCSLPNISVPFSSRTEGVADEANAGSKGEISLLPLIPTVDVIVWVGSGPAGIADDVWKLTMSTVNSGEIVWLSS